MLFRSGYGAVAWGFLDNTFAFADMAIALAVGVLMLLNASFRKIVNQVTLSNVAPLAPAAVGENAEAPVEEVAVSTEDPADK